MSIPTALRDASGNLRPWGFAYFQTIEIKRVGLCAGRDAWTCSAVRLESLTHAAWAEKNARAVKFFCDFALFRARRHGVFQLRSARFFPDFQIWKRMLKFALTISWFAWNNEIMSTVPAA